MATTAGQQARTQPLSRLSVALLNAMSAGVACIDADMRLVIANDAFTAALGATAPADLRSAPEPLGRLGSAAQEVIATGEAADVAIAGQRGPARVLRLDPRHAAVMLHTSGGIGAEADEALARIATLVARDAPPQMLYAAVSEAVARRLDGEAAAVWRFIGQHRGVVVGAWREGGSRGFPVNTELDFHPANSALGRVQATGRPARADRYDRLKGKLPRTMRAVGLRASVAAPVFLGDEVWGAVLVSTTRDEPLPTESEQQLRPFAALVGQAVADCEARLRLVEAADETRRRLERTVHEGSQQHVLALALKLRVARERAEAGSELARLLDEALNEAEEANAALDDLARDLHPAILAERGLAAAVPALAARTAVPVRLQRLPRRRFSPTIEATAYFVVADAIADVLAGHAEATEIHVTVADRGDHLALEVRDDGIPAEDMQASAVLGLAGRVAAVGGRLEVEGAPEGGAVVRAEIPVDH